MNEDIGKLLNELPPSSVRKGDVLLASPGEKRMNGTGPLKYMGWDCSLKEDSWAVRIITKKAPFTLQ